MSRADSSTGCWTRSFTTLLSLLVSLAAGAALPPPGGYGTVGGQASARYELLATAAPAPVAYENDGYRQTVSAIPGGWRVSVSLTATPLKVRSPFRAGKLPAILPPGASLTADLASVLGPCQRSDEAVEAVLLALRRRITYEERPNFPQTEEEVLRRGQASCVGMTRLAVSVLRGLGFECREVLGLKLPVRPGAQPLSGGVLHAWIEVRFPGGPTVFCDPFRSVGWVPETYLVLRVGGGLEPGDLERYGGGTVRCEIHSDRLFFEPGPGAASLLWKRPAIASFTGNLLTGKVLGALDGPATGIARLEGPTAAVSMPLWEGNFFFRDLEPAQYLLRVIPEGEAPQEATVRIGAMDRKTVLFYSLTGRNALPGAKP